MRRASSDARCGRTIKSRVSTASPRMAAGSLKSLTWLGRGRSPSEKGGVPGMRGIVIEFKNCDGHEREVFISDVLLNGDVGRLTAALYGAGFSLDHGDGARKALKRYLAGYRHSERIIVAPRTGWLIDRGRRVAFVLPDEVINTPDVDDPIILDPNYKSAKTERRGTFEEWQKDAPRLARKHMLARFRMSAAFAGPSARGRSMKRAACSICMAKAPAGNPPSTISP